MTKSSAEPELTRWQNFKGTTLVITLIFIWAIGALATRNGDWPERWIK